MRKRIYILLIIISIVLIVGCVVLSITSLNCTDVDLKNNGNNNDSSESTVYTVNLVESEGFELESVPYNGDSELALFITGSDNYEYIVIEIISYDEDRQVVNTSTRSMNFIVANKQFVVSECVDLSVVKSIDVTVKERVDSEQIDTEKIFSNILDKSKLEFETTVTNIENDVATINFTAINPYDNNIQVLNGFVLLYNKGQLVDMNFFSTTDVIQCESIDLNVNALLHDTTGVFEFDTVKVIVNELF